MLMDPDNDAFLCAMRAVAAHYRRVAQLQALGATWAVETGTSVGYNIYHVLSDIPKLWNNLCRYIIQQKSKDWRPLNKKLVSEH